MWVTRHPAYSSGIFTNDAIYRHKKRVPVMKLSNEKDGEQIYIVSVISPCLSDEHDDY